MTQEEKDLLLKYLCMALPYRVLVHSRAGGNDYELREVNVYSGSFGGTCAIPIPYLRPMSSMTDEEKKEISTLLNYEFYVDDDCALIAEDDRHRVRLDLIQIYTNWLLKNHFDFLDLIPKGLAIEVTEENNPYKD